jgi:hypothetical protein
MRVWFGFGGATVLVGWRGWQVSFNTTVGVWCGLIVKQLDDDRTKAQSSTHVQSGTFTEQTIGFNC